MSRNRFSWNMKENRELRKIRKFVCQKRRKNDFELRYLDSIACYLWHAEEAQRRLNCSDYEDLRCRSLETGDVCHGEYNQHNVLMLAQNTAVINFDRWHYDVQMEDLYQFMRKILEKHNWDLEMGRQMLLAYHEEKPMNVQELENLRIRFAYPEKILEAGKLLLFPQQSMDFREKPGKTGETHSPA